AVHQVEALLLHRHGRSRWALHPHRARRLVLVRRWHASLHHARRVHRAGSAADLARRSGICRGRVLGSKRVADGLVRADRSEAPDRAVEHLPRAAPRRRFPLRPLQLGGVLRRRGDRAQHLLATRWARCRRLGADQPGVLVTPNGRSWCVEQRLQAREQGVQELVRERWPAVIRIAVVRVGVIAPVDGEAGVTTLVHDTVGLRVGVTFDWRGGLAAVVQRGVEVTRLRAIFRPNDVVVLAVNHDRRDLALALPLGRNVQRVAVHWLGGARGRRADLVAVFATEDAHEISAGALSAREYAGLVDAVAGKDLVVERLEERDVTGLPAAAVVGHRGVRADPVFFRAGRFEPGVLLCPANRVAGGVEHHDYGVRLARVVACRQFHVILVTRDRQRAGRAARLRARLAATAASNHGGLTAAAAGCAAGSARGAAVRSATLAARSSRGPAGSSARGSPDRCRAG